MQFLTVGTVHFLFLIFFEGLSDRLSIVEPGAYECPGFRKILVGIAA